MPSDARKGVVVLLALGALLYYGCSRGREWEACPPTGCGDGMVCLSPADVCVLKCSKDTDCPQGERCTGWLRDDYSFSGRDGRFCKPAISREGERCSTAVAGCAKGLVCVEGVCRRECSSDDDCPQSERCTLTVVEAGSLAQGTKACAPATAGLGERCEGDVACARGLVCVEGVCRRECSSDDDCPQGQSCSGAGYSGWRGMLKFLKRLPPDFRYCSDD